VLEMRKLLQFAWLLLALPLSAQVVMKGGTIIAGGPGGGCGAGCAYTNLPNIFTQTNTFPALTVTNGVNGLPLYENTGQFNIGLGVDSTPSTATGIQSLGIGDGTNQVLTSGYDITSIGVGASGDGLTIAEQTAIGTFACQDNVSGYGVTCIGSLAGANYLGSNSLFAGECADCDLVTGNGVVSIGASSGCGLTCTSGTGPINSHSQSIYIGFQTGASANSLTNQLLIGYNIQSAQSNYMQLGNSAITAATIYGIPSFPSLTGSGCVYSASGAFSVVSCGGSQVYPGAGVASSTGSAWGTSYAVGTSANDLVQLNGSAALPAVSGANLTALTAANISSGTAGISISGNAGTATALAAAPSNCSSGSAPTGIAANGNALNCQSISGGGGGATLQTNTTNNSSQTLLNFTNTSTIDFTNPSGGVESATLVSPGASTILGFNGSNVYTGYGLGTGLGISGGNLVNTGITGTLSTANCIPKELTGSTIGCSLATDNGTVFSIGDSGGLQVSSTLPGLLTLGSGTGTIPTLGANIVGFVNVNASIPTSFMIGLPASVGAGVAVLAAPVTIEGIPVAAMTTEHMEWNLASSLPLAGTYPVGTHLQDAIAVNSGKFVKLQANVSSNSITYGTQVENVTNYINANTLNANLIYITQNSFTATYCTVWVGAGGTSGDKVDCLLIPATGYDTGSSTASCYGTYTETGTSPNAFVSIPLVSCTVPGGAYWLAVISNDSGLHLGQTTCPSLSAGCLEGATYQGNVNYGLWYQGSVTYGGPYTALPTTYGNQAPAITSAYLSGIGACVTPPTVNVEDITQATVGTPLTPTPIEFTTAVGSPITDSHGYVWTITSGAQQAINGNTIAGTSNVILQAYINGTIWQLNSFGNWYSVVSVTSPTVPTVTYSSATTTSPLTSTVGNFVSQAQALTFAAGDQISLVVTSAGALCPSTVFPVSAQVQEP
jgi:hypothetical protein